jgi:hypothetical protein
VENMSMNVTDLEVISSTITGVFTALGNTIILPSISVLTILIGLLAMSVIVDWMMKFLGKQPSRESILGIRETNEMIKEGFTTEQQRDEIEWQLIDTKESTSEYSRRLK